jgi:hypothetical protein
VGFGVGAGAGAGVEQQHFEQPPAIFALASWLRSIFCMINFLMYSDLICRHQYQQRQADINHGAKGNQHHLTLLHGFKQISTNTNEKHLNFLRKSST